MKLHPPMPQIIVADTNVLINFLNVGRIDLLSKHSHQFVITEHVMHEIIDAKQKTQLQEAIKSGYLVEKHLESIEEIELYGRLISSGRIGQGESSAIAYAIHSKSKLAIDDKRAIKEAAKIKPDMQVLTTYDIVISMISEQLLNAKEADSIKDIWESKYRFRLNFKSFSGLCVEKI